MNQQEAVQLYLTAYKKAADTESKPAEPSQDYEMRRIMRESNLQRVPPDVNLKWLDDPNNSYPLVGPYKADELLKHAEGVTNYERRLWEHRRRTEKMNALGQSVWGGRVPSFVDPVPEPYNPAREYSSSRDSSKATEKAAEKSNDKGPKVLGMSPLTAGLVGGGAVAALGGGTALLLALRKRAKKKREQAGSGK